MHETLMYRKGDDFMENYFKKIDKWDKKELRVHPIPLFCTFSETDTVCLSKRCHRKFSQFSGLDIYYEDNFKMKFAR